MQTVAVKQVAEGMADEPGAAEESRQVKRRRHGLTVEPAEYVLVPTGPRVPRLKQRNRNHTMTVAHSLYRRPSGFTLIEILVVVSIIALLISILLPSLVQAHGQARTAACMSNLHQFGIAFGLYGVVAWFMSNLYVEEEDDETDTDSPTIIRRQNREGGS